jgi:biopolymer transport protein ExbD
MKTTCMAMVLAGTSACATAVDPARIDSIESNLRTLAGGLDAQARYQMDEGLTPSDVEVPLESRLAGGPPDDLDDRLARVDEELARLQAVTARTMTVARCPEIPVRLPVATGASGAPTPVALIVTVARDGQVYVGGTATRSEELAAVFAAKVAEDPETSIVLNADPATEHRVIVELMDAATRAGIRRIAIATRGR